MSVKNYCDKSILELDTVYKWMCTQLFPALVNQKKKKSQDEDDKENKIIVIREEIQSNTNPFDSVLLPDDMMHSNNNTITTHKEMQKKHTSHFQKMPNMIHHIQFVMQKLDDLQHQSESLQSEIDQAFVKTIRLIQKDTKSISNQVINNHRDYYTPYIHDFHVQQDVYQSKCNELYRQLWIPQMQKEQIQFYKRFETFVSNQIEQYVHPLHTIAVHMLNAISSDTSVDVVTFQEKLDNSFETIESLHKLLSINQQVTPHTEFYLLPRPLVVHFHIQILEFIQKQESLFYDVASLYLQTMKASAPLPSILPSASPPSSSSSVAAVVAIPPPAVQLYRRILEEVQKPLERDCKNKLRKLQEEDREMDRLVRDMQLKLSQYSLHLQEEQKKDQHNDNLLQHKQLLRKLQLKHQNELVPQSDALLTKLNHITPITTQLMQVIEYLDRLHDHQQKQDHSWKIFIQEESTWLCRWKDMNQQYESAIMALQIHSQNIQLQISSQFISHWTYQFHLLFDQMQTQYQKIMMHEIEEYLHELQTLLSSVMEKIEREVQFMVEFQRSLKNNDPYFQQLFVDIQHSKDSVSYLILSRMHTQGTQFFNHIQRIWLKLIDELMEQCKDL